MRQERTKNCIELKFLFTCNFSHLLLTFLAVQHIRMINEELLRENGNLKDLVVQTSAGLEREKSNQEKLVHHNKLINGDNATLQSRIEELLSVIDRQRRELASAYESSQRMAFEQSIAWREVRKRTYLYVQ